MKKIDSAEVLAENAVVRKNSKIAAAARSLHESGLDKKCPALVEMFKSANKETQYQAANMTRILENTVEKFKADWKVDVLKEDVTSATAMLSPGVASLTPRVVDIVNR